MVQEVIGVLKRDLPKKYKWVPIALVAAGLFWKMAPTAYAVLATPGILQAQGVELTQVKSDVSGLRDDFTAMQKADSAQTFRILCLLEVDAGIRPALDKTTRCAQ